MARLKRPVLNQAFLSAMGSAVRSVVDPDSRVLEMSLEPPLRERVRVYLYNATNPPGGRSGREHKIQLIVPGQTKGASGNFDRSGGYDVLLVGKATDENAFVLWDASRYVDFAYSSNVQVSSDEVEAANIGHKIVAWPRETRHGPEEVLIAPSELLAEAVLRRLGPRTTPVAPLLATPPGPVPTDTSAHSDTTAAPSTGGTAYITTVRPERHTEPDLQIFQYDPNAIDRGTRAHMTLQNKLAEAFRTVGLEPLSPAPGDPEFDLACRDGRMAYVVEAKSLTSENEEKQLRLGLGQVLSYAYRIKRTWDVDTVQAVLAVEYQPCSTYWLALCKEHDVILTWPEDFPGVF